MSRLQAHMTGQGLSIEIVNLERTPMYVNGELTKSAVVFPIAATNVRRRDLKHDFAHRLQQTLKNPPVREHREDIGLLVRDVLLRRLAGDASLMRLFSKGPGGELYPRVSFTLLTFLLRHQLTGNTRQLDAIVSTALLFSLGDRVEMILKSVGSFSGNGKSPRPPIGGG